jgi:hypothetical protein
MNPTYPMAGQDGRGLDCNDRPIATGFSGAVAGG